MLTNVCGSIPCQYAGGSSTTQRKKDIYIIFRRTLEIELEIWISAAERVRRSAVLHWSETPCTRGGGRTEGFLLVVRNIDAAAVSYARRGGEGLAGREDHVNRAVPVCARRIRDKRFEEDEHDREDLPISAKVIGPAPRGRDPLCLSL